MRRVRQKILTHDRFIPIRKGPPAVGRGSLSLSKEREPFVNGAEGCVRETRKGVLHEDDPHFSELFEALKNTSACRKSLFDMLRAMPCGMAPEKTLRKKVTYVEERDHLRLRRSRSHSSFTAAASRHRPKASARVLRRFFSR